jgi:SnoaL-like domain
MDAVSRHESLFNHGVRTGDFGPWLATFHDDAVAIFTGLPIGPLYGREAIAKTYAEHPPSSTMRVVESTVDVDADAATARFVWTDAPETGGVFVIRLREDRLVSLEVTLDAPPPPPRSVVPA